MTANPCTRTTAAVLGVVIGLASGGCTDVGAPLDSEQFVAILVDFHLIESRREIVADMPPETRDSVLLAHGVSSRQYERAVRYYAQRPDAYLDLYNKVIDSLSSELGKLEESGRVEIVEP